MNISKRKIVILFILLGVVVFLYTYHSCSEMIVNYPQLVIVASYSIAVSSLGIFHSIQIIGEFSGIYRIIRGGVITAFYIWAVYFGTHTLNHIFEQYLNNISN